MPTTLSAGDIAIIGFNFDNPDEFAFVSFVDIETGTEINFTDNGWQAAGSFRANEGTVTWIATNDIPAGTVVNPTLSSVLFSASGDQILAYQGDASNPTFIYGLNSEGNPGAWQSDATSSNTSALPAGLVDGETAVAIDEIDNAVYTGTTSGTRAELLAAIGNSANWEGSNTSRQTLPTEAFTLASAGSIADLVFNEVLPDPNGANNFDTDGDGTAETGDEFVEVFNTGASPVDASGFQFWDAGQGNYFIVPNDTIIAPGGFLAVIADVTDGSVPSVEPGSFAFSANSPNGIINNGGDNLVLLDPVSDRFIQAIYNGDTTDDPTTQFAGFSSTATLIGTVQNFGNDSDGVSLALSPDGETTNPVQHNTIGLGDTLASPGASNVDGAVAPTTISLADVTQVEGDAGTSDFQFTVTRSGDLSGATDVDFTTSDGTATAGADYTANSGIVSFAANEATKIINVSVNGDTDAEPDETFIVTLSNPTNGATLTDADGAGTIENDDGVVITRVHDIQGTGASTPLDGQTVTIRAIVTGDYQDGIGANGDLNGFYVQEEDADADADPLTSEGLFIFDGSAPSVPVEKGDLVEITGTAGEAFGQTQLSDVSVTVLSSGNALPTAATLNLPADDIAREAVEGMLVNIPQETFLTEYFNFDRFGEIVVAANDDASNQPGTDGRLDQFTMFNAPDQAGFAAYQDAIDQRRLVIDDGQTVQNPDPALLPDGTEFSATNSFRGGDTFDSLTGILGFGFGEYRLQPVADLFPNAIIESNPRPEEKPDVGGSVTVASFNVLNFFTTLDVSGNPGSGPNSLSPRGADNQAEFDRQLDKLTEALFQTDADIVGLIEIENEFGGDQNGDGQFAIDTLVAELNQEYGTSYAFVDPGNTFVDTGDAISVGFIYDQNTVALSEGTTVETLTDADLAGLGLGGLGTVFDGSDTNRAPLAATFTEVATGGEVTIAVNHFKSKGGTGTGADADAGDGAGNFNQTRLDGATALEAWLATDPTGSGDEDYLIIGDLNAYLQEEPIQYLIEQGYQSLTAPTDYGFVFDGQFGSLDYALANGSLATQVTGAAEWHINADEPDILDYNLDFGRSASFFDGSIPFRSSDHDPVLIGLDLDAPEPKTTNVALELSSRGFGSRFEEIVDDNTVDSGRTPVFVNNVLFNDIDVRIDAAAPGFELVTFIRGELGVYSLSDSFFRGEAGLVNDNETLIFEMDEGAFGDALATLFEFGTVRGNGAIEVEFFNDGALIGSEQFNADTGPASASLDGQSFDEIQISSVGNTAFSLIGVTFDRLTTDGLDLV